jgi:hypothetical protein
LNCGVKTSLRCHPAPSLKERTTSHREVGTMTDTSRPSEHLTSGRLTSEHPAEERVRPSGPQDVIRETAGDLNSPGDAADQAERLRLIMEAEAVYRGLTGDAVDGSVEGRPYPLEDAETLLAMENAEDSSDDPMHAGGLTPERWVNPEEAAMHVVDPQNPEDVGYLDDETPKERADVDRDQFDGPVGDLTPEDETLLGVDPYDD